MKNEFIITSTNSVEGEKIEKYLGVINNNIVLGTNLFSDIGASLLDVFGGASNSYQNKLQSIYDSSIQNLKVKAINLGANAILGLSIDFDEISGGNKSMLMISVSGTAVIIHYKKSQVKDVNTASKKYISNDILKNELTKKHIIKKVRAKKKLVQDEWNFLQQNPISDLSENLIDSFLYNYFALKINSDDEKEIVLIRNFSNYLRVTDPKRAIDKLYKTLPDEPDAVFKILEINKLFSPQKIINLLESGFTEIAISCLSIEKENYTKDDLKVMNKIIKHFELLKDKGEFKKLKGLLGKQKDIYICPNGHSNHIESVFCEDFDCQQNIKGLTRKDVRKINSFKNKVETLRLLFDN